MSETKSNGFEVTLREMRGGRSLHELSEKLAELVAAVKQTGKAGAISYIIKVKPASAGDVVTLQLEDDVKAKIPELARGASIFFADDANVLQRTDPRQREFKLTTVPDAAPEPLVKVG